MPESTLEELMEAGVHFGHQTNRWNPKMRKYIWGKRNGIYIIDLTQTTELLDKACAFVRDAAGRGKKVVFVGTKKQVSELVESEARRAGAFFINRRWLGGTLTNFEIIRTRINKLRELEDMRDNGHFERLPKKEVAMLTRQLFKLERSLGGIKEMRGMPDILFVVDQRRETLAMEEAHRTGIPVISIVDTNCDPTLTTFPIPGNDDAMRSLRLLVGKIANAMIEGRQERDNRLSKSGKTDSGSAPPPSAAAPPATPPALPEAAAPAPEAAAPAAAVAVAEPESKPEPQQPDAPKASDDEPKEPAQ